MAGHRKYSASDEWAEADLTCLKDGDEIVDMSALAEHVKKGHLEFCMIIPTLESYVRALNIDGAARLYREVTDLSGMNAEEKESLKAVDKRIRKNISKWTVGRRKDLRVQNASSNLS